MNVGDGFALTYCSNIHPGESWREVRGALAAALPAIRRELNLQGPMGVGLRLSAAAAATLAEPAKLEAFQQFLADGAYSVFTINGFPYGAFHGERVKERVYEPDWRAPARVSYTNQLAEILAKLLDEETAEGTVSTVPGAFRARVVGDEDEIAIARGILVHAARLVHLKDLTGRAVTLALEPEPACLLESAADAIRFFETRLFDPALVARVARETGLPLSIDDVRERIGVCFDACHMAVEFESPADALGRLRAAGIRVPKVQISSALRLPKPTSRDVRVQLDQFADDTYLHQVVERQGDTFLKFVDLPEALAAVDAGQAGSHEWRVHFHVPIFLETLGAFRTTQPDLIATIDALKHGVDRPHLEVETYTWDVLPAEFKTVDLHRAIARELAWVKEQFES